jgi:hypothetical protein
LPSSLSAYRETTPIPFIEVEIFSAINFKKRESVLVGITVTVVAAGPDPIETTIEPIFCPFSLTETKVPLSKESN